MLNGESFTSFFRDMDEFMSNNNTDDINLDQPIEPTYNIVQGGLSEAGEYREKEPVIPLQAEISFSPHSMESNDCESQFNITIGDIINNGNNI